jgi:CDP-diglyceride synthetase
MAALIAGAQLGIIPSEPDAFFAPPPVITAIWVGLLIGAALVLLPERSPAAVKGALAFLVLCLVAIVCNWSAFAPGVTYTSSTTIGVFETTQEDAIGGRIVFGLVALFVDLVLIGVIGYGVRQMVRRQAG